MLKYRKSDSRHRTIPFGGDRRPRWVLPALVCGVCLIGCDSGGGETSGENVEVPQAPLAPAASDLGAATPPGKVSISELRDQLGVGEEAQFVRTGDEITQVELFNTGVSDLSPLEGLPLTALGISDNPVTDLSPLAGMPLKRLSAQDTQVTDLSPLANTQLEEIYLLGSPVGDLSPLAELPITRLNLVGTKITDLSAVREMPLHTLWIGSTAIEDLSALKGKSLVSLDIEDTSIDDLSPLANMNSLRRLNIAGTQVTDLTPLKGHHLERLIFDPARIQKGLEIVREMPSLRVLGVDFDQRMPAQQFWAKYDAGEFK